MPYYDFLTLYFIYVSIFKVDRSPPTILTCPPDTQVSTELGTTGVSVFWDNPSAIDVSGIVDITESHSSGDLFAIGETLVEYTFKDQALNTAKCNFTITISEGRLNINTTVHNGIV